jgi:hypothetical protein
MCLVFAYSQLKGVRIRPKAVFKQELVASHHRRARTVCRCSPWPPPYFAVSSCLWFQRGVENAEIAMREQAILTQRAKDTVCHLFCNLSCVIVYSSLFAQAALEAKQAALEAKRAAAAAKKLADTANRHLSKARVGQFLCSRFLTRARWLFVGRASFIL